MPNVSIKKADNPEDGELQVVYGEVYAPNLPDVDGEVMNPLEVRKMAYRFMQKSSMHRIDINHDTQITECFVVESFIASEDQDVFLPGSWVVGVHIPDTGLWDKVKKGELNGFSLEGFSRKQAVELEFDIPEQVVVKTIADYNDHVHNVTLKFDANGDFMGGITNTVNGHSHRIVRASVTSITDGHSHRFSLEEAFTYAES